MHEENGTRKAAVPTRGRGFLTRLARDRRGNALAIVGAALVPLAAMIGSGVDMSRAYMAKTRLQSACDAAALAGRRIMTNDQMTDAVRAEAVRFFNFNFRQGLYDTTSFTPAVTRPEAGTVRVTASTRIPTSIMHIFGFESLPLNVTCDASLNFVNTDVMLVLDVTGSMSENIAGGTTRIAALREAVMALYDELRPIQTQLEAAGLRLRYGVVPYSSTVNVGTLLRQQNPAFIADDADYLVRMGEYNDPVYQYVAEPQPPSAPVSQTYTSSISQDNCDKYGQNQNFSGFTKSATSGGGPAPTATWVRTFSNNEQSGVDWGWPGSDTSGTTRSCRRRYVQTNTTYEREIRGYTANSYTYFEDSIDLRAFKLGGTITVATNNGGEIEESSEYDPLEVATMTPGAARTTIRWNGCIEERDTSNTINETSGYSIPDDANDLDINLIPDPADRTTLWRPHIPELTYLNSSGWRSIMSMPSSSNADAAYWACPAAAERLRAWTRTEMESYVNGLQPIGGTYHDIGMIWGARMISSGGVFADSPDNFNSMPVARHIIFMTDGALAPNTNTYTAYGVEQSNRRVTGTASMSTQAERHRQRFRMICNATRGQNVSIWVIAFAVALEDYLVQCASNASQASTSTNKAQLIARFREIGNNIGALRLTQ